MLDERELTTVLLALRYWQEHGSRDLSFTNNLPPIENSGESGDLDLLSPLEIGALCERLEISIVENDGTDEESAPTCLECGGDLDGNGECAGCGTAA